MTAPCRNIHKLEEVKAHFNSYNYLNLDRFTAPALLAYICQDIVACQAHPILVFTP